MFIMQIWHCIGYLHLHLHPCRTILGLLSILRSSVRKGSSVFTLSGSRAATPAAGTFASTEAVQSLLQQWHLSCPWIAAPVGGSCMRHAFGPLDCPPGDAFALLFLMISGCLSKKCNCHMMCFIICLSSVDRSMPSATGCAGSSLNDASL
jgi:hypothetical protein